MSTPYRLGENAKLYYSATLATSLSYTTPTLIAANVKNVKITAKNDTPEYTTRNNGQVKQYANSLTDLGISFEMKVPGPGATDAAYTAFQTAYVGKGEIAAYAMSDLYTVVGAEGPGGNWIVSSWDRDEGNGNVLFVTVELKPSTFNSWVIIAS